MQFRWFMIPSLYRSYDRSSNREQKDLPHGRYDWPEKSSESSASLSIIICVKSCGLREIIDGSGSSIFLRSNAYDISYELFIEDGPK